MRLIYILPLFLLCSLAACSQQQVLITKKCQFDGNKSFPDRNTICQKIYFEKDKPAIKVEYAVNGWQVIDSLIFDYIEKERCTKSFSPVYDLNDRTIKEYKLVSKNCEEDKVLSNPISKINDKYRLSKEYLLDLQFLLEQKPVQNGNIFELKENVSPSLFQQYGVPFDESLHSFSFTINDNLIANDIFRFENYTLTREYKYDKDSNVLKEVQIVAENKQNGLKFTFREYFKIE